MYLAGYTDDVYVTVLDEMNIARVEYYFAEMLSILEMPSRDEWVIELVPSSWDTDPKKLEAMVIADGDNFSLAIGKKGQNARLATRLTKFKKIDIKTTEQAREAGINFR